MRTLRPGYRWVTNLRIWPIAVYRFYNERAAMENITKELKADYPLAEIPNTHSRQGAGQRPRP